MTTRLDRILPLLAIIAVIAVNAAANILPLNAVNTGEVSAMYPTGFTPAGWVFRIWSLIYLGLLGFGIAVLVASPAIRARAGAIPRWFVLNAVANIGWVFAWHYQLIALSFLLMCVILATLLVITTQLRHRPGAGLGAYLLIDAPFSLYLGWITTATLANLGNLFFALGTYPFALTMDQWALVTVVGATAVYVWVTTVTRDVIFGLVFVWAGAGIALRPSGISEPVQLAAMTGAAMVLLTSVLVIRRRRPRSRDAR